MLAWKQPSSKECAKSALWALGNRKLIVRSVIDCKGNIHNMTLVIQWSAIHTQVKVRLGWLWMLAVRRGYEPNFR